MSRTLGVTLLIVDDDERFRAALARAVGRRGFAPLTAATADEALALAARHDVDRAIVDLRIATESGIGLIRPLLERRPGLEIVVLTAYASIATAVEAIKLGAVQYLAKPADPDTIVAAFSGAQTGQATSARADSPSLRRLEWEHIQHVLGQCDGNISEAARRLGMHRRTLQRKLAKRPVRR